MCAQCDVIVVGGMHLNIVVIVLVVCFVASVMLSLLINVFICNSYRKARCADFC